jgi:hypothetical protein
MGFKSRNASHGLYTVYSGLTFGVEATVPVRNYVDPATTAMVTQIVAGIVISIGVALGLFWRKILLFFQNAKIKRLQKRIEKQNSKED